jgi:hypothetical protein
MQATALLATGTDKAAYVAPVTALLQKASITRCIVLWLSASLTFIILQLVHATQLIPLPHLHDLHFFMQKLPGSSQSWPARRRSEIHH